MSYIIFCEENIYNRVSFDRMATVIRSQRIIGDVILYLLCSSLILFLLCVDVVPCRRLAAAQWWTGWIARPRLALLTTRQEDLDVVDLSRLFVGSLRLHYRLITWCQGFAACFLLPFFFFFKCQTHKWTDKNWNEWRDDCRNWVWIWQSTQKTFTLTSIDLYWILIYIRIHGRLGIWNWKAREIQFQLE